MNRDTSRGNGSSLSGKLGNREVELLYTKSTLALNGGVEKNAALLIEELRIKKKKEEAFS